MRGEDYKELVAHTDGYMRCEVCGVNGPFEPTAPTARQRLVTLTA
jgi:hypothetical protein